MKTLSVTKFVVRKIVLLMMIGIFLVGCAHDTDESGAIYQKSAIPIDFGVESRTDLNGDGKEDRVRVIDRRDVGLTTIIANVNGIDVAIKDYRGYCESTVTTGDLTGNGKADVLLKRATRGTDSGTVNISILHLENTGWMEYSYNFIHNPDIDLEQPDTFDDEVYLGATLFEKDGKVMVRFISFHDNDKSQNTVKCTEASYCEDGWYIEDIKMIPDFFSGDKFETKR